MPKCISCFIIVLFLVLSPIAPYPILSQDGGFQDGCALAGKPSQSNRGIPGLSDRELKTIASFFDGYYKNPQPDKVVEVVQIVAKAKALRSNKGQKWGQVCFFAEVFKQNESKLKHWEKSFRALPKDYRLYIAYALRWSKTEAAKNILDDWSKDESNKAIVKKVRANPVPDLNKIDTNNGPALDVLWAAFMASGNVKYVDRIIQALANDKELNTKGMDKEQRKRVRQEWLTAMAAQWSLAGNAFRHERVYDRLKFHANSADPNIRRSISEILKKVDERKAAKGK
jgi:hypothetical protein